jgi:P4 family phage/plasmid primase-like protien
MNSTDMETTDHRINHMTNHEFMCPPTPPEPKTANEAAAICFPDVAKHFDAFVEAEESDRDNFPSIRFVAWNHDFWAHTIGLGGCPERPVVFVTSENQFRRYNPDTGLYTPITTANVVSRIMDNLEICADFLPRNVQAGSILQLKNRQKATPIVERARELLAVSDDHWKDRQPLYLPLINGVLCLDGPVFHEHHPIRPIRETLPVKYEPHAQCLIFLNAFLRHILEPDDIDLLQRSLSQILEGRNHSQTMLVLMGDAGWGKSSLLKILGTLLGWNRIGIIRDQLFRDPLELAHYQHKHLLLHPDLPTDFLDRREASIFKQLVGGDPLWADVKGGDGRMVLEGHYPVILACNGKPKIHLDEDADAWLRRLVVLSFKTPDHEQHMGKMAELILKTESSGILNWLLEGRKKLLRDKLQLKMTPEQKARAANLLMASQSPGAFVQSCLEKRKDSEIAAVELYTHYQEWCIKNGVRPFASQAFTQMAKEEIELKLGLRYRHDLGGVEGTNRGWKGVVLVESAETEKVQEGSAESESRKQMSRMA